MLELGEVALASRELVLAEHDLCFESDINGVQLGFSPVELADPVAEARLQLGEVALARHTRKTRRPRARRSGSCSTVFSHGGSVLLHSEESAALTEAYYIRHAELSDATLEVTRRSYEVAVRYGALLFDSSAVDVTRTYLGGENQEVEVEAPAPLRRIAAGTLWGRIVRCSQGMAPCARFTWTRVDRISLSFPGRLRLLGARCALVPRTDRGRRTGTSLPLG